MRPPNATDHVIMGTASKFIFVNIAFVGLLISGNAAAAELSERVNINVAGNSLLCSEVSFDPADGGECRGENECAAGGAY